MGTVHNLRRQHVLTPDDLRFAGEAFDIALQQVVETTSSMPRVVVRHSLAAFIINAVMRGERDRSRLAIGALASVAAAQGLPTDGYPPGARTFVSPRMVKQ